ncbi:unnamed protein product [Aureobasidium vineae]|uniref:Uncharacterized protein n=1 Tax=Aureobasidium vineae TaxID=2773715 RepID=A0A9N8PEC2_9PEZI|nr:unnamed protein product [Aureobasidium vineae]
MKLYGNQEDDLPLDYTEEGRNKEDDLPIDYTFEERIKRAQSKMGDRTAFFYGKNLIFSIHLSWSTSLIPLPSTTESPD